MQKIEAVGINVGPGSFTGIRACTTVGRVIAQQVEIPLVNVSSLKILSKIAKNQNAVVTLDARKGCVFVAVYEEEKEVVAPKLIKIEELETLIKNKDVTAICDNIIYNKLKEIRDGIINYEEDNYPLNEFLIKITYEKLKNSKNWAEDFNWAKVKPLYIQPPSVFGK